ncbi:MAG: hypothetical protein HDQ98_13945 [Lachnospiraceae bacterium]|nr:hypothetical protein [Lachnospiraceae bacterium]
MNNTSKRIHRRTVYWLIICTFMESAVCTSCGRDAFEENSSEILNVWTAGALELATAECNTINDTETAEESYTEPGTMEEAFTDETGGNPAESHSHVLEITVFEDNYFYENHEVSYDELLLIFEELKEGDIVTIYDENASLNACQKVISYLEERKIMYMYSDT